jgi:hypothetical protein
MAITTSLDNISMEHSGGSITVQLTSCLTCLDLSVLQINTKIVSCHTTDSKPVKQEVNSTVIPPLVFPDIRYKIILFLATSPYLFLYLYIVNDVDAMKLSL